MPKQKITKEMVVDAAFEIARVGGMEQVLVKKIAARLDCSVQPVYSYLKNMEELRQEVGKKSEGFVREYVLARIDKEDLFRSIGRAYVSIAKEEPNLFRIFVMHRRDGIASFTDLYEAETIPGTDKEIAERLHISVSEARQLHLNMMIYTIGIGTIFAMTTPGISSEEVYGQQELAYQAFLSQAVRRQEEK